MSAELVQTLQPLTRPQLIHHSVRESLKTFVLANRMRPGDPLPPEGELARQLGVSRNSVREAIKALESVGFLEVRRGIGVFVKAFSLDPLIENLPLAIHGGLRDVEEILELRRILEVALIEKAIALMPDDDIIALGAIIDRMGEKARTGQAFPEEDRLFHRQLFECLGNNALIELIEVFWRVFNVVSGFSRLENPDHVGTYEDHRTIFEAVAARDVAKARDRLAAHYDGIARTIERHRGA